MQGGGRGEDDGDGVGRVHGMRVEMCRWDGVMISEGWCECEDR